MQISQFNSLAAAAGFDNAHRLPLDAMIQGPQVNNIFSRLHTLPSVAAVFSPQSLLVIVCVVSIAQMLMLTLLLWQLMRFRRRCRRFFNAAVLLAAVWLICKKRSA